LSGHRKSRYAGSDAGCFERVRVFRILPVLPHKTVRGARGVLVGVLIAALGVAVHMAALAVADRTVSQFPTVPDVLLERLPFFNLFAVGEALFWLYLLLFAVAFFRQQPVPLARVLVLLGIYYAVRGLFLLLLPIGPPPGALPITGRFVLFPYPEHAYFPGGHVGLMFLLALHLKSRRLRWAFVAAAVLYGIGTMLARAHYSADTLGGLLLGYAVFVWGDRNLHLSPVAATQPGK
jgi:membrane-associated phospholipid phosphatase